MNFQEAIFMSKMTTGAAVRRPAFPVRTLAVCALLAAVSVVLARLVIPMPNGVSLPVIL